MEKVLQDGASIFEDNAEKLKKKYWTQNMIYFISGAIVSVILLILLYFKFSDNQHLYPQEPYQPRQKQPPQDVNPAPEGEEGSNGGGTSD